MTAQMSAEVVSGAATIIKSSSAFRSSSLRIFPWVPLVFLSLDRRLSEGICSEHNTLTISVDSSYRLFSIAPQACLYTAQRSGSGSRLIIAHQPS